MTDSKMQDGSATGTAVWRILTLAYLVVIAALFFSYVRRLPLNRQLEAKLSELTLEKQNLLQLEAETQQVKQALAKLDQQRQPALSRIDRAIELTPFEDLNLEDSPFFIASHRRSPNGMGMEVIVNIPPGDQRLVVAFPSQADLQRAPVINKDHWPSDFLYFRSSEEVILESGECYEVSYGLSDIDDEDESMLVNAKVRTKETVIFDRQFQHKPITKEIMVFSGTRNTCCRPGEILDPFIFNMNGVQRPKVWEWGLSEYMPLSSRKSHVHSLRFTYENEPTAFISPWTIIRFEQLRRNYKWNPLPLADVFEADKFEGKFIFKAFPSAKGRSESPLY